MTKKTDPDKKANKLKRQIVIQHNNLALAVQVIERAKAHPAIGDLILEIIKEVKFEPDGIDSRQKDMDQLMVIFQHE